ncbi:MAG: hypothetical protein U5K71_15340 [Gracilimonas sp.]|nr:hypothetical protein [Gracilimonas sp.]
MGPWGTTYATNLRLRAQEWSEDAWVQTLKTRKVRPPTPGMDRQQRERTGYEGDLRIYSVTRTDGRSYAAGCRNPVLQTFHAMLFDVSTEFTCNRSYSVNKY